MGTESLVRTLDLHWHVCAAFDIQARDDDRVGIVVLFVGPGQIEKITPALPTCVTKLDLALAADDLAVHTGSLSGADLRRSSGENGHQLIDLRKPFFIGRDALGIASNVPAPAFDYRPSSGPPLKPALYREHVELGAKLMNFAGWEMPLQYTHIVEEYGAVRQSAALFDLSHMGILEVNGVDATWFLDQITTNYIPALRVGYGCYSFLLAPDGHVLDDCYIYRLAAEQYLMVINAANTAKIKHWLMAITMRQVAIDPAHPEIELLPRATIRDLTEPAAGEARRVNLALQGPYSERILEKLASGTGASSLRRNQVMRGTLVGCDVIIARTGYTGEKTGFELYIHPDNAAELWQNLLRAGAAYHLRPAGLGARDLARIEAGFPLYGHELAGPYDISPIGAGYGAFVKFHKPFFIGRRGLLNREATRTQELVRFRVNTRGKRVIRSGNPVVSSQGRCIGFVTSSAVAEAGQVGLAYLENGHAQGNTVVGVYALRENETCNAFQVPGSLKPGAKLPPLIEATIMPRYL
jgi:glycine hydroxymethyltransferase